MAEIGTGAALRENTVMSHDMAAELRGGSGIYGTVNIRGLTWKYCNVVQHSPRAMHFAQYSAIGQVLPYHPITEEDCSHTRVQMQP